MALGSRWLLTSLIVLLSAGAASADPLRWELGDATQRYDLEITETPDPAPTRRPLLMPLMLLAQSQLEDGRRPTRAPSDPGELVWLYSLDLPPDDPGRRGVTVEVDETFSMAGGQIRVQGEVRIQVRGRRAALRSALRLTGQGTACWVTEGALMIERTFDVRNGALEQGQFTLDLVIAEEAGPRPARWSGRITPGEAFDPAARDFHARVQDSIDRGAARLLRQTHERLNSYRGNQTTGGQSMGQVALLCFALLRSGIEPRQLEAELEWLSRQPFIATYSVALYVMLIEALHVERHPIPPQAGSRSVARYERAAIGDRELARMEAAARWLLAARKQGSGWWSYYGEHVEQDERPRPRPRTGDGTRPPLEDPPDAPGPLGHDGLTPATGGDHSNCQFAVLALHSALASGIEIPNEVWDEILTECLGTQSEGGDPVDLSNMIYAHTSPFSFDPRDAPPSEGGTQERGATGTVPEELAEALTRGWGYGSSRRANASEPYGSMTAAGISSLAIAREGLLTMGTLTPERDREARAALLNGLAWYVENFTPARHAGRTDASWYFYYLYSVEKAMDLAGVERLGLHEWWRDGASELLARQEADGGWANPNDTAMALLFLNRATLPAQLDIEAAGRVATGHQDPALWDQVTIPDVGRVRLRQVLRALEGSPPALLRERLELAREGLAALDRWERPRLIPEVASHLDAAHRNLKAWAEETCLELAGTIDPEGLTAFSRDYERLRSMWLTQDTSRIPVARQLVVDRSSTPPLKQAALMALSRVNAKEAAGDVIAALEDREPTTRQAAYDTLVGLVGARCEFDAQASGDVRRRQVEAWRDWWRREGTQVVEQELARRAVSDLAFPSRRAESQTTLRRIGRPAVRYLIDGLRQESTRPFSHELLQELTGQTLPAEVGPWLDWHGR
jgi:hypothetical protein